MTIVETPAAITTLAAATNRGDAEAFAVAFTHAYLNDWGCEYHGRDGVRAWDGADNIGAQARFELDATGSGSSSDTSVAILTATGAGHNGTGPMTFRLRGGLIASLWINP